MAEATAGVELTETPDLHGAFPRLNERHMATLAAEGVRRSTERGELLFREGDPTCNFFVIAEGMVAIVEGYGCEDQVIGVHGPGRFLGELNILTGEAVFVTAVVEEPGEVIEVPVERLRRLVARDPDLGDLILRAYLIRRSILIGLGSGFRIVGSRYSPDTRRLREFAVRNRLPHRFVDLEKDRSAEELLKSLGVPPEATPVVIWRGSEILRNPSTSELARRVGLRISVPPQSLADLLVVGAGPAGLAASVYGASEGLTTITLDSIAAGGQAGTSPRIENYLGFPSGLSGSELAERALIQAEKFGARISVPAAASALEEREGHYVVKIEDGGEVAARAIVIAAGVRYRKLDVDRLAEFEGISVFYAATQVEAQACVGDPVAIVGGGNSAGQAALFLSQHAARVRLLVRDNDLRRNMSRYLVDLIGHDDRVEVCLHTAVRELIGHNGALEKVVVEDTESGRPDTIDAKAMFIFIGADPHTAWLRDSIALDENGFVLTGEAALPSAPDGSPLDVGRSPFFLETSFPGVFAAGDIRSGSIKRVAAAVGEGSMAIRFVYEHFEALQ
jgi:thioredoxin reductase (NADPH)